MTPFSSARRTPIQVWVLMAGWPLVRTNQHTMDLREDFVQAARTHPGLYLDGIHLAAMGGEPFAIWN
jgi:hypothetical protein